MEINSTAEFLAARPPQLEDAGLEDCALPVFSIHEAFRRAASAVESVRSAATSIIGSVGLEGGSHNPGAESEGREDACVDTGGLGSLGVKDSCVEIHAGGLIEEGHDRVVDVMGNKTEGKLLDVHEVGPKLGDDCCLVDEKCLPDEPNSSSAGENDDGPILTGAYL